MEQLNNSRRYYNQIKHFEPLSYEEEVLLFEKIHKGDQKSKEKVIQSNLRLVFKIALDYKKGALPLEDIINEGNIGLMYAVGRFELIKKTRFSTYAVIWIRKYIVKAISETSTTIHLPTNKFFLFRKIQEAKEILKIEIGRNPFIDEVSKYLNVEEHIITELWEFNNHTKSIHEPHIIEDGMDLNLIDVLPNKNVEDFTDHFTVSEVKEDLDVLIGGLSLKQRQVIELFYGLNLMAPLNLKDIGQQLNISAQAARQLKERAMSEMEKMVKKRL